MTGLDEAFCTWINQFAGRWPRFDLVVQEIAYNDGLKGMPVIACFWARWNGAATSPSPEAHAARTRVLAQLFALGIALAANRILASLLPHAPRPLQNPDLGFTPPTGMPAGAFGDLSSFPSDHAVLFLGAAFALGTWRRKLGIAVGIYAGLIVLAPRLYLGLHYPSDLLVGGILGALAVVILDRDGFRPLPVGWCVRWSERQPALFGGLLFFATCLMATLFDPAVRLVLLAMD